MGGAQVKIGNLSFDVYDKLTFFYPKVRLLGTTQFCGDYKFKDTRSFPLLKSINVGLGLKTDLQFMYGGVTSLSALVWTIV